MNKNMTIDFCFEEFDEDDEEYYHDLARWAEDGWPNSQYEIGLLYLKGEAVYQSKYRAMEWFEVAAEQGDEYAQAALIWFEDVPDAQQEFDSHLTAAALEFMSEQREGVRK
jgi:TPR repeat protein